MLWDKRELCDCITNTLSQVSVNGYQGNEREFEFARHLITRATMMKRINISYNASCSKEGVEETLKRLMSLPRSFINVSIVLKPVAPEFEYAEVGKN